MITKLQRTVCLLVALGGAIGPTYLLSAAAQARTAEEAHEIVITIPEQKRKGQPVEIFWDSYDAARSQLPFKVASQGQVIVKLPGNIKMVMHRVQVTIEKNMKTRVTTVRIKDLPPK